MNVREILLWGLAVDPPMSLVRRYLGEKHYPHIFLNHADLDETDIEIDFDSLTGSVVSPSGSFALESIGSFYFRPYDFRSYPDFQPLNDNQVTLYSYWLREASLWHYAELCGRMLINPPIASAGNQSKPLQAELIAMAGFLVPDTLVTSIPEEALDFKEKYTQIVYKSTSAARSIVKIFDDKDEKRLGNIVNLPVQFQQYIAGVDYRVHIVGRRSFATKITSAGDDYRYASALLEGVTLPEEVDAKCFALSELTKLPVCGIDLRATPDGDWYCFEANPSPGFSYYETQTGQPISAAIGELLYCAAETPL